MKPAELRAMPPDQLDLTLKDTIKNLFHLRCQAAAERLETPSELRKVKREVARILTLKRERALVQELLAKLPEAEAAPIRARPASEQLMAVKTALARRDRTELERLLAALPKTEQKRVWKLPARKRLRAARAAQPVTKGK
jgi:large subunit ribosomal protein L29